MQDGADYYRALIERGFPAETALQNAQQHFPGFQLVQPQAVIPTPSQVMTSTPDQINQPETFATTGDSMFASTQDSLPQQKSRDGSVHGYPTPENQMTNIQQQNHLAQAQQPIAPQQQQAVGLQAGQLQMAAVQPGQVVVQPGAVGQQQMVAAPMVGTPNLGGTPVHPSALQSPYGIPIGGMGSGEPIPFSFGQSLFSFEGRMRRLHFGFIQLGLMGLWTALVFGLFMSMLATEGAMGEIEENEGQLPAALISMIGVMCIVAIPAIWVGLAVQVKRLHDLEQSGFLVLVPIFAGIIPFIGGLRSLGFVGWLIFADGTAGQNKFGPDPKGRAGAPQVNPAGAFAQQPF